MGFLAGKKALIVGLATDRSIAWGISQAMRREGARTDGKIGIDHATPRLFHSWP